MVGFKPLFDSLLESNKSDKNENSSDVIKELMESVVEKHHELEAAKISIEEKSKMRWGGTVPKNRRGRILG